MYEVKKLNICIYTYIDICLVHEYLHKYSFQGANTKLIKFERVPGIIAGVARVRNASRKPNLDGQ